jgi:hypothetical protein
VVLLLAELTMRVVGPHLQPNQTWADTEDEVKVAQMRSLAQAGNRGGFVFIGSSLADVGVDPEQFIKLAGLRTPAYNAALGGGDLAVLAWWTTKVVVPILHPRVVVLGVSSVEFNANDTYVAGLRALFFDAPAVHHISHDESLLQTLERKAEDWSYLFRYRKVVRDPAKVRRNVPKLWEKKLQTPLGMYKGFLQRAYVSGPEMDREVSAADTHRYQVDPRLLTSLRSLAQTLHRDGIRLELVDMPITQHYIDLHPRGSADFQGYESAVRAVADQTGTPMMPREIWDTKVFADPVHLNAAGAALFTRQLGDELKPLVPH